MRSRIRTSLTAAAAVGLITVALIGCQPSASPTDADESLPGATVPGSIASEEPSASPSGE